MSGRLSSQPITVTKPISTSTSTTQKHGPDPDQVQRRCPRRGDDLLVAPAARDLFQELQVAGVRLEGDVEDVAEERDRADGDVEQDVRGHPRGDRPGDPVTEPARRGRSPPGRCRSGSRRRPAAGRGSRRGRRVIFVPGIRIARSISQASLLEPSMLGGEAGAGVLGFRRSGHGLLERGDSDEAWGNDPRIRPRLREVAGRSLDESSDGPRTRAEDAHRRAGRWRPGST